MESKGSVKERTKHKVKEPGLYSVIILNDDFTTMEFVVEILIDIFHKDAVTAETIMLSVHRSGRGVVGSYPYDIAATKVKEATARARAEGFPLRFSIEEDR